MTHDWVQITGRDYRCQRCNLTLTPRVDRVEQTLAKIGACPGDPPKPVPVNPASLRRMIRQQCANSIRLQYDLGNATVPLRTAAGRFRQCCRCEHLVNGCCDLIEGSCGERRPKWIKAIVAGRADWCPLVK